LTFSDVQHEDKEEKNMYVELLINVGPGVMIKKILLIMRISPMINGATSLQAISHFFNH
jgi:hypothetical protein